MRDQEGLVFAATSDHQVDSCEVVYDDGRHDDRKAVVKNYFVCIFLFGFILFCFDVDDCQSEVVAPNQNISLVDVSCLEAVVSKEILAVLVIA